MRLIVDFNLLGFMLFTHWIIIKNPSWLDYTRIELFQL